MACGGRAWIPGVAEAAEWEIGRESFGRSYAPEVFGCWTGIWNWLDFKGLRGYGPVGDGILRGRLGYWLRVDLVVPCRQLLRLDEVKLLHLLGADLGAFGVWLGDPDSADAEPGLGHGGANVVQDGLESVQRAALPVVADGTEEAVLYKVPLVMRLRA